MGVRALGEAYSWTHFVKSVVPDLNLELDG